MQARIIERVEPGGRVKYIIQQKHFLFWWSWVDAWINSSLGTWCQDDFDSLDEAKKNLCYFDGTPFIERVVHI